MSDLSPFVALGGIALAIIAIGGVLVKLIDRINKVGATARKETEAAAAAARAENEALAKELANYKLKVAEDYVTVKSLDDMKKSLSEVKKEILDAVAGLSTRVNQLFVPKTAA